MFWIVANRFTINKWVLVLLFGLTYNVFAFAQNNETVSIKGAVLNKATGEGVKFVNLRVVGTTYGAATLEDGSFELSVPKIIYQEFTLQVSVIGYDSELILLKDLNIDSRNKIFINPVHYALDVVDVNAESRVLFGIVKKSIRHIPDNFLSQAYKTDFLFSVQESKSGISQTPEIYKGYLEDSLGWGRYSYENAFRSLGYSFKPLTKPVYGVMSASPWFDEILSFDVVRNRSNILDVEHLDNFHLSLESVVFNGEDSIYVIRYRNLYPDLVSTGDAYVNSFEGKIWINQFDYSIIKYSVVASSSALSVLGKNYIISKPATQRGTNVKYEATVNYEKSEYTYKLKNITSRIEFNKSVKQKIAVNSYVEFTNYKVQNSVKPTVKGVAVN